jgi:hypothetical protein
MPATIGRPAPDSLRNAVTRNPYFLERAAGQPVGPPDYHYEVDATSYMKMPEGWVAIGYVTHIVVCDRMRQWPAGPDSPVLPDITPLPAGDYNYLFIYRGCMLSQHFFVPQGALYTISLYTAGAEPWSKLHVSVKDQIAEAHGWDYTDGPWFTKRTEIVRLEPGDHWLQATPAEGPYCGIALFCVLRPEGNGDSLSIVNGSGQSARVDDDAFPDDLQVRATRDGEPVVGAEVSFTIRGNTGTTFYDGRTTAVRLTGLNGTTPPVVLIPGHRPGRFRVEASSNGAQVRFRLAVVAKGN